MKDVVQTFRANSLAGHVVPERRWAVPGYIPDRTVTILGGDGGTGKSLLALQLAVAVATSSSWLGLKTQPCGAIYLSAEDELEEIHRRLHQICVRRKVDMEALGRLEILPLAGRDALLAVQDRANPAMKPTPLWQRLREIIAEVRPGLLVIDTLADVFGGDEISRVQTRSFIGLLRGLALEFDLAIVLLAHPSLSGMASRAGSSGSTAWSNSVRSRLYFERDDEDANARFLSTKKANYAAIGAELKVWWRNGVFESENATPDPERMAAVKVGEDKIDALFLKLFSDLSTQGHTLSPYPSANYAPKILERYAGGVKANALAKSMDRLLIAGKIHIEEFGPPSKRRSRVRPGPQPKQTAALPVEIGTPFEVDDASACPEPAGAD